jgi:two-component system, NarL family, response regulator
MPGNDRITVMCVEDHGLVREGLCLIINHQPDMHVIASAASGEEAVALFKRFSPDVTLMDLQLPGMNGVEAIQEIHRVDVDAQIVVLAMHHGAEDIYRAMAAGAANYLMKDSLSDDLVRVVRQVHAGERRIPPDLEAWLAQRATEPTLTKREIQVIELISEGKRNKEIATALGISDETVHVHVRNVLGKLKVNDRSGAISVAVRRGIIHIR